MPLKRCIQCKQEKTTTEFYKNKSKKDGLQNMCKVCTKENGRKRIGLASKLEYHRRYNKLYEEKMRNDPNFRAAQRERKKLLKKLWREKDVEKHREKKRIHYLNNKEYYKLQAYKRRCIESAANGSFTAEQLSNRFIYTVINALIVVRIES